MLTFPLLALAQTDQTRTGSIAGRVMRGDKPLAGILVFANRLNQYGGWQPTGATTKTDGDGRYQLANLAAGNYLVSPCALADVFTEQRALSYGKPVLVQAGEVVENVDFALVRGGVITGTVTDDSGKPVVGVDVRLLKKTERGASLSYFSPLLYLMSRTDDRGVYRLFGLLPDKYLVRVGSEEDGTPVRNRFGGAYHPPTYYPDVTNEAEAKVVEVTSDSEQTDIDIKLAAAQSTYVVKGRIIDAASGLPIVGARVQLTKLSGARFGTVGLERTNLQGEFRLSGFGPGSYTVALAMEDGFNYYTEPKKFEVVSSDVAGLELKAALGNTVSGRVVIEGTKDPTLLNVRGLTLGVFSEASDRSGSQSARLSLNPDGSFRVAGLRPGKARFNMGFGAGAMFSQARPIILRTEKDGQSWPHDFPIAANENAFNVRIIVAYGVGVVRGQVKVSGEPASEVGQVRVSLVPVPANTRETRMAITDAGGRFLMEGLLPGDYQIVAVPIRPAADGKRRKPPVPQPIVVAGEKETQITLTLDLTGEEKP